MREQIHTTGQAKLSERLKWRISVKLTKEASHLYQFVPGTNRHKWEASFVRITSVPRSAGFSQLFVSAFSEIGRVGLAGLSEVLN